MSDYLDDEEQIAEEQDRDLLFDSHALFHPIQDLPELQPVVCVSPSTTVRDTISDMVQKRVGCVVVVEGDSVVGVFSERDVLTKVAASEVDTRSKPVSELMTRNPETLNEDSELVYALHKMALGGYRHVPILDENGKPVAVVSMRDIVGFIASLYPDEVMKLPSDPNDSITSTREGA